MKKLTFLIIVSNLLLAMPVISQEIKVDTLKSISTADQQFKEDLKAGVNDFESSKKMNELVAASNHLTLIANKFSNQWAANYYASYSLIVLSYIEKDAKKKDAYLDDAEVFLNKAVTDYKAEYDELYVLKAMFASARLSVQPASRYKKYGDLFNENIEKAKTLQPNNPRIYYLKGNSLYYTPKMFGGGAKKALVEFEKAEPLFGEESNNDIFKPYWGERENELMLEKCKVEIK